MEQSYTQPYVNPTELISVFQIDQKSIFWNAK